MFGHPYIDGEKKDLNNCVYSATWNSDGCVGCEYEWEDDQDNYLPPCTCDDFLCNIWKPIIVTDDDFYTNMQDWLGCAYCPYCSEWFYAEGKGACCACTKMPSNNPSGCGYMEIEGINSLKERMWFCPFQC